MENNSTGIGFEDAMDYVPNDPEFDMIVRLAFNALGNDDKEKIKQRIETNDDLKEAYEGVLMIIDDKGFQTTEEYLEWVEEGKACFNRFYENYNNKGREIIK